MKNKDLNRTRFALYLGVVLLINLVSSTLFFRLDLTQNKVYSLSKSSIKAVASLEDPLTIRVFLSENLPAPHTTLAQEVRDLLEEYALQGNRFFNYRIYEMDKEGLNKDEQGTFLTSLARDYGVRPIQLQSYSSNDLSLVSAYMGMVVLQGNLSETYNTLGFTNNLEYQVTTLIEGLASKTSALLALEEDVKVRLVFSSPLLELGGAYRSYPEELETLVDSLQGDFYGRLAYEYLDPRGEAAAGLEKYGLTSYVARQEEGAEPLYAALLVESQGEFLKSELIENTLLGARLRSSETMKEPIKAMVDRLLGVQVKIGYLRDKGAPPLVVNPYFQQGAEGLSNFDNLLSQNFELEPVTLGELPEGLEVLIIAGVNERLSDWELFQLDQFLLKGGKVALFLDPFKEESQGQMAYFGMPPSYTPLDTGLRDLLAFHGVDLNRAFVMDSQGFVSFTQDPSGGVQERKLPFAPVINRENINKEEPILMNIKELIMLNVAPLNLREKDSLQGRVLFSSSKKAWLMEENIDLNPGNILPPGEEEMAQYPLAVLVEGEFESYFKDRPLPEPPQDPTEGASGIAEPGSSEERLATTALSLGQREAFQSGEGGALFVLGSSKILYNNVLDEEGLSPNGVFVQNIFDYLSGQEDRAVMRSKGLPYNPIRSDLSGGIKALIRTFNTFGLPLMVIMMGILVWFHWRGYKKKIQQAFSKEGIE